MSNNHEFERELERLSPKPVPLDLSVIDHCVNDASAAPRNKTAPQWRIATASWLVGLATGILVAFLGGNALQDVAVPIEMDDPQIAAERVVETETTIITALPPAKALKQPTDYLAVFSPANADSANRMSVAARELLVSFTIDDHAYEGPREPTSPSRQHNAPKPPASLSQLRKELQLAL